MSYNSLIATAVLDMPLQDDAASTVVVNNAGTDGTLVGGDNTADLSTTGPTGWLPKALQFDGTADYIAAAVAGLPSGAGERTYAIWANPDAYGTTFDYAVFSHQGNNSTAGTSFNVFAEDGTFSCGFVSHRVIGTKSAYSAGTWVFVMVTVPPSASTTSDVDILLDGGASQTLTNEAGSAQTLNTTNTTLDLGIFRSGGTTPDAFFDGSLCGFVVWDADLSANAAELYAGPEPTYTSGATLASNGAYDVGTWSDPSNGTRTYEWVVVEADGTVVDSGTGATGTADFGLTTGLLTLLVRASNDGGYDVGDFATRTSGYGSSGDGYYEVATVTAVAADGLYSSIYPNLAGSVY